MTEEKPHIIFEDASFVALHKPSGLIVNRSDTTTHEETLQDWIDEHISLEKSSEETDFVMRSGIVHRLDKETSGVLLIAKNEVSFKELQRQFKERIVQKTYITLVHGTVIPAEGEINVPVGRLVYNRKRFGVVAGGRESVTYYKTLKHVSIPIGKKVYTTTLLEVNPKTGRTHQIRVHMQYLKHPVFSDMLYGGRKTAREDRKVLPRLFLHAKTISFLHPQTMQQVSFEDPLPLLLEELVH